VSAIDVWRECMLGLLCDGAGESPWVIAAGHFHRVKDGEEVETADLGGAERAVKVRFDTTKPRGENRNDHNTRSSLRVGRMEVRVSYVLTHEGIDFDASGEQSGGASRDAIVARAEEDRARIVDACGWYRNHGGLTPNLISVVEGQDGSLTFTQDRGILVVPFELTSRRAMPASAPPIVGS